MSWLDDLLGKTIQQAGVAVVDRKIMNFVSGATVTDNESTGATDVVISAGGDKTFAGSNPNASGDSPQNGARGDFLRNTGVWNGFEGWSCIIAGSPATWVPTGRGGNVTSTSVSYQALSTDLEIWVGSTSSQRTITLPDISTIADGFFITIKDTSFSNTGNDTLVHGFLGTELIDGLTNFRLPGAASDGIPADGSGAAFTFVKKGSAWSVRG